MKISNNDRLGLEIQAEEMAERYRIRLSSDLESFSRQLHEAIESGILDYVYDRKKENGNEDLDEYEVQY